MGILNVDINNNKLLKVHLNYDLKLIFPNIIAIEILLFLDIIKMPTILDFDKHPKFETSNYKIIRNDICCEMCFKNAIDDLFEIEGIEKVESNFIEEYFKRAEEREKIVIDIEYNPNMISIEKMKQIELELDI